MSLSDEILVEREKLTLIRDVLSRLLTEMGAKSAFLIDEAGVPFAAVGNVEFRFPHPLPDSQGGGSDDSILKALLGMGPIDGSSPSLLFKASSRALLVVILEQPRHGKRLRRAKARLKAAAREIKPCLESPTGPEL